MKKENLELAIGLRHELHAHPELSYQEVWTKRRLIDFLKENTRNLEIVDEGKYFYAIYRCPSSVPSSKEAAAEKEKKEKRNIAFRADFDALPIPETINLPHGSKNEGVSHKCGHDGHSASLMAFALEVDQLGAPHNIFFLFQHAEETGQGAIEAQAMIEKENIDEIFGYHNMAGIPSGYVGVIDGPAHCASRGVSIEMVGAPSHASEPEKGKNPAYVVAELIAALPQFTSANLNEGLVLATIVQIDVGSENYGIQAHTGALRLTIRAEKEAELDKLQQNIEKLSKEACGEAGIEVCFKYSDVFPETSNHKESSDEIREICKRLDIPIFELEKAYRCSEDYGYYLKKTKGAYCYIGNGEHYAPIHTFEYDFRDENIPIAVKLYKGLVGME